MHAIELRNVTKTFGKKQIISNCSLAIEEGDMIAITGASGSGKTTLLNMIGLIEPPTHGEISILGEKPVKITHQKQIN